MKLLTLIGLIFSTSALANTQLDCSIQHELNGSPSFERFQFHYDEEAQKGEDYNGVIFIKGLEGEDRVIHDPGHIYYKFEGPLFTFNYEGEFFGNLASFDGGSHYEGIIAVDQDYSYFVDCKKL